MEGFSDADFLQAMQKSNGLAAIVETNKKVVAWFYPHPVRDDVASMREGRTIYHDADYVMRKAVGDKDSISGPVTKELIAQFPQEWATYMAWKQSPETSVKSLPGIGKTPSVLRYCEEAELWTIEKLAAAEDVRPELVGPQAMAQAWVALNTGSKTKGAAPAKTNKGGRPKGSKNKPKVPAHGEDAQVAA